MNDRNINSEDSISLSGFKNATITFLRLVFEAAFFLLSVVKKGIYIILIGLVIGVLASFIYFTTKKSNYEVSMIVNFNRLGKKTFAELLDQLNRLAGKNGDQLTSKLNTSSAVVDNILYINYEDIIEGNIPLNDSLTKARQPFKIMVGVENDKLADSVSTAILFYLNNGPFAKKIKNEERKIFEDKLLNIENDLRKLDTLKSEFNRFLSAKVVTNVYTNAMNPGDMYFQTLALLNQKERVQRLLNIENEPVALIEEFKQIAQPLPVSRSLLILLGGIGGAFLGFIIALIWLLKNKIYPSKK